MRIAGPWAKRILSHRYPRILLNRPKLIHGVYAWNKLTQLRNWYVGRSLGKLLKACANHFTYLDAGFGEGMYLLPFIRKYPQATFKGIDKTISHIQFAHEYRKTLPSDRLTLCLQDLESLDEEDEFDLISCIGVLQYVADDRSVLQAMKRSLCVEGKLLLYVPINGEYLIPAFGRFYEKWSNYEQIQGRKRIYSSEELLEKVRVAGFELISQTFTYGFWGKLAYEAYTYFLSLILRGSLPQRVIASILLLLFLPFQLIFMSMDYFSSLRSGNGVLLILE
ncbi:MAG: methyltransferase domain-containing protein [Bacteroidota bacterium]